jgi:hypothetical protein
MLLPTRPRRLLGCAIVFPVLMLTALTLIAQTPATASPPPPTGNPVFAFLPAQALVPADPPDLPLTSADFTASAPLPDLLGPSQAISVAWRQALAGLTSGQASAYEAVLDAGYTQTAPKGGVIRLAETERRLDALLASCRVADARFGVTACRMTAPDAATVAIRERLELLTRNTPPTLTPMPNGGTAVMNNTVRLDTLLVLRQDWVLRGTVWKLKRLQLSQQMSVAVL